MKQTDEVSSIVIHVSRLALLRFTATLLALFGMGVCGADERSPGGDSMLVPFQSHDTLCLVGNGSTKSRWREATGKTVSAEGVLSLKGKTVAPRLLLDNTSVYLAFDGPSPEEADGTLARVTGRLVLKSIGSGSRTSQTAGQAEAYFIIVDKWQTIDRVKTLPIVVE